MKITLLCNAGLAIETEKDMILVDAPNGSAFPFYAMPTELWNEICQRKESYNKLRGFFFTHNHPDHYDRERLLSYPDQTLTCFVPGNNTTNGVLQIGEFLIEFHKIAHAPIPNAPPHVVAFITAEGKRIYIAADAETDAEQHMAFFNGRKADVAFWNAMYLSKPQTRALMAQTSERNYIYHMPLAEVDQSIWRKCEKNYLRYPDELQSVKVFEKYTSTIEI